ncbi:hypothetical protein [Pseudoalteromonas sp. R3]|uniref:hypothetical protein n=1 Tax=Pseudoalteromonas sp. R3 TaxID=1709477 RepID=UPI0006B4BC38|nr:hypothetical protein [Pseudoalteromonas sp. R3]AZZ97825.1 hypothetical protein ELR70_12300 [Pseudoalteromonas sp. R3]
MKQVFFIIVFFLLLPLFNQASAASGDSSGVIKTILWYEGHTGVLIKQTGMSDLGKCGRADYYILDDHHPFFQEIYSLLLAAHMASQPLSLHLDGCVQGISRIKHVTSNK